jgi:hypothetical protein
MVGVLVKTRSLPVESLPVQCNNTTEQTHREMLASGRWLQKIKKFARNFLVILLTISWRATQNKDEEIAGIKKNFIAQLFWAIYTTVSCADRCVTKKK